MKVAMRITTGQMEGTPLLFPPGQYLFGRAEGCHVLFSRSSIVSRRHCLLIVTEEMITVRDLESRNGTCVNKMPLEGERQLEHGDLLEIGESVFQIEITKSEAKGPLGIEVSGKPLDETINMPLGSTATDTKLALTGASGDAKKNSASSLPERPQTTAS